MEHVMSCDFPEGCSCGAQAWNNLKSERDNLEATLRFARRIIGSKTENEEAIEKIDNILNALTESK